MKYLKFILTLLAFSITTQAVSCPADYGTTDKAACGVACLMSILEGSYPAIILVFVTIGGFKYISSGSDTQEKIMGKKFIMYGLIGGAIIIALIHVSCVVGLGGNKICPDHCSSNPTGVTTTVEDGGNLINPPNGNVITLLLPIIP